MWQANKHFALKLIYFNSGQLQISDVIYLFVYLFIYLFIYFIYSLYLTLIAILKTYTNEN